MKDALFIQEMLQRGKEAADKVKVEFLNLSLLGKMEPDQHIDWQNASEPIAGKSKKESKGPEVFVPSSRQIDAGVIERFHKHLDTLLEYIAACKTTGFDKTHITSPVSKFITYSLRNAITILIQHEHRHINQAIKIEQQKVFPQ